LTELIKSIANRLPEVTDRKIRGKWEKILSEAAIGNFGRGTERVNMDEANYEQSNHSSDGSSQLHSNVESTQNKT
jgi:hypothetical protein